MTLFGTTITPTGAMFAFALLYDAAYLIFCHFKKTPPSVFKLVMNFAGTFAVGEGAIAVIAVFNDNMRHFIDPAITYGVTGIIGIFQGLRAFGKKFDFRDFFRHLDPDHAASSPHVQD